MTDADGQLVFHEQFYAADSVRLWGTIGKLKNNVHEGIVRRVLSSARSVAAGGPPQDAKYTYDDFERATADLPSSLRSVYINTAVLGGGYFFIVSHLDGSSELGWAREADHVDWPTKLGVTPPATATAPPSSAATGNTAVLPLEGTPRRLIWARARPQAQYTPGMIRYGTSWQYRSQSSPNLRWHIAWSRRSRSSSSGTKYST